jgi:hypothetical protein
LKHGSSSAKANGDPFQEVDATTLSANTAVGATNIKVASVAGLAVGDFVRIGFPGNVESRKLTVVGTAGAGGTGLSFVMPLERAHRSGDNVVEITNEGGTLVESNTGNVRRLPTSAYRKWELRVPGLNGRVIYFTLKKAIMTENAEFEAADDGALAPRLTLQARWDPAASTVSPWSILRTPPTS